MLAGLFLLAPAVAQELSDQADSIRPVDSLRQNAVERAGLIFSDGRFSLAHASTLVETSEGVVAAWYARTGPDQPTSIWSARFDGRIWSFPRKVADGRVENGATHSCWNPVLFQPAGGPVLLFYRVGPSPREWIGVVRVSADGGVTWSEEVRLPKGFLGPIRTKPVQLADKAIVMGSSTEHDGWVSHVERFVFPDQSRRTPVDTWTRRLADPDAWSKTGPIHRLRDFAAIQPALVVHEKEVLQLLARTKQGIVSESWSSDGGRTWSPMVSSGLPNPNAGIDALRLSDGRYLIVLNPQAAGRNRLAVWLSNDGLTWQVAMTLEAGEEEFSYPAVIQTADRSIHIAYSWKQRWIKHVQIDPDLLLPEKQPTTADFEALK